MTQEELLMDDYSEDAATFGDRLALARESQNLTQEQLAKRLGLRVQTVQNWEFDRSEPRANKLQMLAGVLNVSIIWMLTWSGEGGVDRESNAGETAAAAFTAGRRLRAVSASRLFNVGRDGVEKLQQLLRGTTFALQPRPLLTAGKHVAPTLHRSEEVDDRVVQRARAHLEYLVELFIGEVGTALDERTCRPAVVCEEDLEGVGTRHRRMVTNRPRAGRPRSAFLGPVEHLPTSSPEDDRRSNRRILRPGHVQSDLHEPVDGEQLALRRKRALDFGWKRELGRP